ncbi:hypothetical protein [Roseovarius sp. E0-M6]|uniref:hypothetical protein n=1 Tax=Roseovarius sp. E0-M6 TaxID=3127118 RepID=UPI00301047DA
MRSDSFERDQWALDLEEHLLQGGASFSEWATLMSYEAHTCFVAGADISTIILCASTCEAYLKTEQSDYDAKLYILIEKYELDDELKNRIHKLRKLRNSWVHSLQANGQKEISCYSDAYTPSLERDAKFAYETMLMLLFSNPFV